MNGCWKYLVIIFLFYLHVKRCDQLKPGEVLTGTKWRLVSLLVENPTGSPPADITTASFDPCELDDLVEFKTGGNYSCSENSDICANNSSIFYVMNGGNWVITGDTLLSISAGFILQNYRFGKITNITVELRQSLVNYFGDPMVYRFNFRSAQ